MIRTIVRKELKEMIRDGRFRIVAIVMFLLLVGAIMVSNRYYQSVNAQRAEARKNARSEWVNQGQKNPHSAAHYGTYAFKPKYPLSLIDNGVEKYTGISIFLEAHKRSEAQYAAAQDQTALSRFGDLSPDFILMFLMPLFIILIGFNAITREKESGTWRLVLSQGITGYKLVVGKWLGVFIPIFLVLLLLYIVSALLLSNLGVYGDFSLTSLSFLFLVYLLYYIVFVNVTLVVSSVVSKSNLAFVILLGAWILSCLAMPKISAALANAFYPYPTQLEFEQQIAFDKEKGLDGHNPFNVEAKKLEEKTLKEYGVDSVQQLPFNWDGFLMQEGEKHEADIYFKHYQKLKETFYQQSGVYRTTAALSPFLPTRFLSMAISRTDYTAHWHFADAAEKYRIEMVGIMNGHMMDNSKTGDWYYKVGREVWETVPEFHYEPPSFSKILNSNSSNLMTLLGWVVLSFSGLFLTVRKLSL